MLFKSVVTEMNADTEKNIVQGYASIFGNIDSHKDIVVQGAFKKTIQENNNRIKFLWQHDLYEPIGKPTIMQEDSKGLYFEAKISETDIGKKAMTLIKDGVLNEMSIGYDTIKDEFDTKKNVRLLKEIRLWEISVVTLASNSQAQITGAKKLDNLLDDVLYMSKAGRTISESNMNKIRNAIQVLQALLEDSTEKVQESEKSLSIDVIDSAKYQSILDLINKYK
jgi:HK97 family phage prohead protease